MVDWPSYNRSLVRRGEILFSFDFLDSWGSEIERDEQKQERQAIHIPRFFHPGHWLHPYSFHLPYRQTEEIITATGKRLLLPANPSYGHICKRINKLTINIKKDNTDDDDDDHNLSR